MQIVIDIPDKVYGLLKYFEEAMGLADKANKKEDDVKTVLMRAVIHGALLPKGHGRLIDEDTLPIDEVHEAFYNYETVEALDIPVEVVYWDNIKSAHAIIEAYKESEE